MTAPQLLIDVVVNASRRGVRYAQDDLVHWFKGYNEHAKVFEFYCERPYIGNAWEDRETFDEITCVACLVSRPW